MPLRAVFLLSGLLVAGCRSEAVSLPTVTPIVEAVKVGAIPPATVVLPNEDRSIKFAIIGDSGRGRPSSMPWPRRWPGIGSCLTTSSC